MLAAALDRFPCPDAAIELRDDAPGAGICCLLESSFGPLREIATSLGERGLAAEKVAHRAANQMNRFLATPVPIGLHLADQLLLPLALAGSGSFATLPPDEHLPTNIAIIQKFLPTRFTHHPLSPTTHRLSAHPA